jgi:[acyl-carrier-protein] S-malonyltransferase
MEELKETKVTQPAVFFTLGYISQNFRSWLQTRNGSAGHLLGESVLVANGALSEDGLKLVSKH